MKISASRRPGSSQWVVWTFLGLALLVAVGVRVRLLDFPLERDEGCFAYIGQLLLEGIPPYQQASDFKMPGLYLAYAAMMSVFGQTPAGIHLGLLVVQLATWGLLFLIARRFLDLPGAVIATAAAALMTLSPAYVGLAAHATNFIMPPALLGIWLLLRREGNGRWFECLAAGGLFGIAFLMKQPGMIFGVFGGLYLGWASRAGKLAWLQVMVRLGLYTLGCLLPFLAVCLWLKIAGVFPQFWFWTIVYPREYGELISFNEGAVNAWNGVAGIFHAAPLLWLVAGAGLVCACVTRQAGKSRVFLTGFLVFSGAAVCPGWYFREHYFIVLVPAVALLAGLAVSWSGRRLAEKSFPPWLCQLPFWLAALACAQSLYADRTLLFSMTPREACREVYTGNPFPEAVDIGSYLAANSPKDARIVVLGSEPEIYFYAHRHAATSQIYMYPLMDLRPYARQMREDMFREIEQNSPEYLVLVMISGSWLAKTPESIDPVLKWAGHYTSGNMEPVGLIQIIGPHRTDTVWGPAAATMGMRSKLRVVVFKKIQKDGQTKKE